jgi:hypothetical protein
MTRPALPLPVARALAAAVLLFAATAVGHALLGHSGSTPSPRALRVSDLGADAPAPAATSAPRLAQVAIPPLRGAAVHHRSHKAAFSALPADTATPAPTATASPSTPSASATPETTLTSATPAPAPVAPAPSAPAVNAAPAPQPARPPASNRPATPPGQAKKHGPSFDSSG